MKLNFTCGVMVMKKRLLRHNWAGLRNLLVLWLHFGAVNTRTSGRVVSGSVSTTISIVSSVNCK